MCKKEASMGLKKGIVAILLTTMIFACSDDNSGTNANSGTNENSGNNAASTESPQTNASTCDLATAKLPPSELAWKANFAGGCDVTQTISLESLQKFDTLLTAAGYEKNIISNENFRYTKVTPNLPAGTLDKDTLFFTYIMETFAGTFSGKTVPMTDSQKLEYELREVALATFPEGFCDNGRFENTSISSTSSFSSTSECSGTDKTVVSLFEEKGWAMNFVHEYPDGDRYDYDGTISYNGTTYKIYLQYEPKINFCDFYIRKKV